MTEVLDIGPWRLAAALLLIAAVFVLSFRERLGLERSLLVGTVRTFLQLFLVGYVLQAIFALEHWAPVLGAVAVMVLVATHTAVSRLKRRVAGITAFAAIALTAGSGLTLAFVSEVVIGVRPWFDPQYLIPIAGMIVGNAMNGAALAGERFQAELKNRVPEVETLLALGFPAPEALAALRQEALRAALIPSLNAMMVVGIVQLPGMMTGQILAGSSPLVAVKYQIVVMLMLTAAVAFTCVLFLELLVRRYYTPAHQLRRHLVGA